MTSNIMQNLKSNTEKTLDAFKKQLAAIRTGRANASLLEGVKIDYYGSLTPISQIANITVQDSRTLVVKPWERNLQKNIEKAITDANLGLLAVTDGDIVRVPVPALTEERRKEFTKQAKSRAEEAKIAIRNNRRDANELLKQDLKNSVISEDEEKRFLKQVQDATDAAIINIDELLKKKEEEIMTI